MPNALKYALEWDKTGEKLYETGCDHGVIYPQSANGTYPKGAAWNGLTAVNETPSGAEANPIYADNIKYAELRSAEEFGATVEAFTYPEEFAECDGSKQLVTGVYIGQQKRKAFGLCYRTRVGNDVELDDYGYKLHLVYGATASPSEKAYSTVNDSPEAGNFSWEMTTTPVPVSAIAKARPTSLITIDSTKVDSEKLAAFEQILYGTAAVTDENGEITTPAIDARLPLPDEVYKLFSE